MSPSSSTSHSPDTVHARAPDGSTARISRHGAQVLSWIPAGGREQLFLSGLSPLDGSAPVRGGVPVIFPQFADYGPLPKHGFARDCEWRLDGEAQEGSATLHIEDSAATRARWPHAFACRLTVSVGDARVAIALEIENRDATAFEFTVALHTYLRVHDIDHARIEGLQGMRYRDRTMGDRVAVEEASTLAITGEVDRLYVDAPRRLLLVEPGRRLTIASEGFADVVVWNPWIEKARLLTDLPDDGYRSMLCIEPATVATPVRLAPGERWKGTQTLVQNSV